MLDASSERAREDGDTPVLSNPVLCESLRGFRTVDARSLVRVAWCVFCPTLLNDASVAPHRSAGRNTRARLTLRVILRNVLISIARLCTVRTLLRLKRDVDFNAKASATFVPDLINEIHLELSWVNIDIFYKSLHIFSHNKRNTISAKSELRQKRKKERKKRKEEKIKYKHLFYFFYVKCLLRLLRSFTKN